MKGLDLTAPRQRRGISRSERAWRTATAVAVGVGVGFSVLLMTVAFGVADSIDGHLADPALRASPLVDVSVINQILAALTAVVTAAMLAQTAVATFTLGVTAMRSRREEIAIRRQSGALRSRLIVEFVRDVSRPCLLGGVAGEGLGVLAAVCLSQWTVLPVRFNAVSLLAAFPVTVLLAIAATLWPAWTAANTSPALLRR